MNEANMDAFNRSFEDMSMESRRPSARVGSQSRRGLESRRHDDMDRYDEDYISPRHSSTRDEPRRRRGMESGYLDDTNGFDEEGFDPRRPSTRVVPRRFQDTGPEHMDRPIPDNYPRALGGGRSSRVRTTNELLPLAEVLAEHNQAQEEEAQGEEAMRRSLKNSVAYNEGLVQRDRARSRVKHLTKEIYKHDPDQDDMDRVQRIIAHFPSKGNRNREAGGSSRSRRGPTPNRVGEHGRKGHSSGHGGDQGRHHGHGGHRQNPPGSDFY